MGHRKIEKIATLDDDKNETKRNYKFYSEIRLFRYK